MQYVCNMLIRGIHPTYAYCIKHSNKSKCNKRNLLTKPENSNEFRSFWKAAFG